MSIFGKSYLHPNKGREEIMGSDKGANHVTQQESNSWKRKIHSGSWASIAAILKLENDLFDFH